MTLHIGLHGATGRVGRAILAAGQQDNFALVSAKASANSDSIGVDAGVLAGVGPVGVAITSSDDFAGEKIPDVWIDFSLPEACAELVRVCVETNVPLVTGTTGFSVAQGELLRDASRYIPIVVAPNMSIGVNVMFGVLQTVARVMGPDCDVEIVEAHHRNKLDAPSGTAVRLGEIVAETLDTSLEKSAVYGRQGRTGARDRDTIGFATIRGGDIVGEHTVMFAGEGERVELTHRGSSRLNFARGALRAAGWVVARAPGYYDMQDVLDLR